MQFKADWKEMHTKRQTQINKDNKWENKSHIHHAYNIGNKILVANPIVIKKEIRQR